jgi:hypothetical protein
MSIPVLKDRVDRVEEAKAELRMVGRGRGSDVHRPKANRIRLIPFQSEVLAWLIVVVLVIACVTADVLLSSSSSQSAALSAARYGFVVVALRLYWTML